MKKKIIVEKKCYYLSFPILWGGNSTRALKKSQKITLKKIIEEEKNFAEKKKKMAILFVFQYQEDAIRPKLSSPAGFRNTKISKNLEKSS